MGRGSVQRPLYLADKLTAIRLALRLSQNDLIQELDMEEYLTQSQISAFELGKRVPPLIVLLRYARLVKIQVDDLIDDKIQLNV